jgi:hypothetical protein
MERGPNPRGGNSRLAAAAAAGVLAVSLSGEYTGMAAAGERQTAAAEQAKPSYEELRSRTLRQLRIIGAQMRDMQRRRVPGVTMRTALEKGVKKDIFLMDMPDLIPLTNEPTHTYVVAELGRGSNMPQKLSIVRFGSEKYAKCPPGEKQYESATYLLAGDKKAGDDYDFLISSEFSPLPTKSDKNPGCQRTDYAVGRKNEYWWSQDAGKSLHRMTRDNTAIILESITSDARGLLQYADSNAKKSPAGPIA